mmetsp:Transcript_27875/g.53033  ORF Transcript_27875/g.53033 Transcript_27875/m.53033 type:complete len:411 (-) Transcript_27875:382-1614(-)
MNYGFVSGGQLGVAVDTDSPDGLRQGIADVLLTNETVTRALKRLRPVPGNKKRAASKALDSKARAPKNSRLKMKWELDEPEPPETKDAQNDVPQPSEEDSKELFNRLTEYAGCLLDLGFEDIYTETREQIVAGITGRNDGGRHALRGRERNIWHDCSRETSREVAVKESEPSVEEQQETENSQGCAQTQQQPPLDALPGVEHEVHLETVGSNNESVLNDDAPNQKDTAAASGDADPSVPTKASAVPSLAPLPPPPYQQPSIDPAAASVHHIPNPHQPHGHVPPQSYGSLAPHNFPVHSGAPYAAPPLAHPHYHHPAAVTAPPYNDYHYNGHYGHAHNPPAPVPVHHLGPYTHHPPHHHAYPPLPVPAMYQPHQWPASAPHHFHHQPQPHPYGSAGWYPQHPAQYPPGPGC